ncbi:uncharacterized protein LOC114298007 isoform X3 [Camellia sinensis]|uniref:uncharacterized protein LOC114298007 isoform X3 n=1 Tax=Camellia sinensis TaxID=4442 RepID=UPI001036933A|nr:uncharacterized protein LOC114298007 isoform X3 [Camellia sinensis]
MDHENVIKIKDIIRPPEKDEFSDVYTAYELMDIDLYQIIHSSQELTDDHCQAWLMYFWRRAEVHGVEEEIAKERLQFWIICSGHSPTSHDAVDGFVDLVIEFDLKVTLFKGLRQELTSILEIRYGCVWKFGEQKLAHFVFLIILPYMYFGCVVNFIFLWVLRGMFGNPHLISYFCGY